MSINDEFGLLDMAPDERALWREATRGDPEVDLTLPVSIRVAARGEFGFMSFISGNGTVVARAGSL